jgi:hypothetical protein
MRFFFIILLSTIAILSAALDEPTQVHIALAGQTSSGDSNTIAVSWNTQASTPTTTVKYGTQSHQYTNTATGSAISYYETYNHHVVLDTLIAATNYYYIVGDNDAGWSKEFSFTSAPLSSHVRGNFSFFVYGDLGIHNGGPSIDYINTNKDAVSLVWHGGDVSYADDSFLHKGCYTKFCFEETFDQYMKSVEPWASKLPYMVAPGNHEAGKTLKLCLCKSNNHLITNRLP